jgi:hypothetical protein
MSPDPFCILEKPRRPFPGFDTDPRNECAQFEQAGKP